MLFEVVAQVLLFNCNVGKSLGMMSVEKVQLESTLMAKIDFTMAKSISNRFYNGKIDFRMPKSIFAGKVENQFKFFNMCVTV